MSGKGTAKNSRDPHVENPMRLMKRTHIFMMPKAMRSVRFSSKDVDEKSKRMWIHRRLNKKADTKPSPITLQSATDVSPVSFSGNYSSISLVKHRAPKIDQIRKTLSDKQKNVATRI